MGIPLLNTSKASSSSSLANSLRPSTAHPMSPGRAQNRRVDADGLSRQNSWLRFDMQWPTASENPQKVLPLCAIHAGEIHLNFDPKLNDWIAYRPEKIKEEEVEVVVDKETKAVPSQPLHPASIDVKSSTEKSCSRSPSHLAPAGLRTGSSSVPLTATAAGAVGMGTGPTIRSSEKKDTEVVDSVRLMSKWFDVLNALLLQVQIDPIYIYAPRKSLAFSSSCQSQKLARNVREAMGEMALIRFALPSVSLENVAHKPMIQQFTSVMPFVLPDSLWNINRDNLPWTLKLSQFAIDR